MTFRFRRPFPTPTFLAFSFALAALVFVACDGGGSTGGGGGDPTGPEPFLRLVPDVGTGPRVSLQRQGTTGLDLRLEVVAAELPTTRTVDFVLVYPGGLLDFVAFEAGPFLGAGVVAEVALLDANRAQVFLTGTTAGGDGGDGVLWRADFRGVAAGTGRIEFENPEAADPNGLVLTDVAWLGADVEVSP